MLWGLTKKSILSPPAPSPFQPKEKANKNGSWAILFEPTMSCIRSPSSCPWMEDCCNSRGRTRSPCPSRRRWSRAVQSRPTGISALGTIWCSRFVAVKTFHRTEINKTIFLANTKQSSLQSSLLCQYELRNQVLKSNNQFKWPLGSVSQNTFALYFAPFTREKLVQGVNGEKSNNLKSNLYDCRLATNVWETEPSSRIFQEIRKRWAPKRTQLQGIKCNLKN